MKLGDVLRKERERKKLTAEDVAWRLGIPVEQYREMEGGYSDAEVWGPRLANIAVALHTPTSRFIAETGRSADANPHDRQCGTLIHFHREKSGLSGQDLAEKLEMSEAEIEAIEGGATPLETYAPILLRFAEIIDQPIFNLFYPCGLPLDKLADYP